MKLPGAVQLGVQSLGRENVGRPLAVANAEARASAMWAKAVQDVTKFAGEIITAQDEAAGTLLLNERVAADKRSFAQLEAYMASTSVVNLAEPTDVPEVVFEAATQYAKRNKQKGGTVRMSDIATQVAETHFNDTRKMSYDLLGKESNGKALQAKYNADMEGTWATSAGNSTRISITHKMARLEQDALAQVTAAVNSLDEEAARKAIIDAEQSGALLPEKAGELQRALGSTIDFVQANQMIQEASRQGELDAAEDFIDQSRVDPGQRIKLGNAIRQQQNHMYTLSQRWQDINYGKGMALLSQGQLTRGWIEGQLSKQAISGAHANTLLRGLASPPKQTSDSRTYNRLAQQINLLRYPDITAGGATKRKMAEDTSRAILTAQLGVSETGEYVEPQITADDADKLMDRLQQNLEHALGANNRQYAVAEKQIRLMTRYQDTIAEAFGGDYPAGRAYSDFLGALQDAMDSGHEPMEFVARNAARFTPEIYEKQHFESIADQFPQYREFLLAAPPDPEGAMAKANLDVARGRLSYPAYQVIRRRLAYRVQTAAPAASRPIGVEAMEGTR